MADVIHDSSNFRSPLLALNQADANLNIICEDRKYTPCKRQNDVIELARCEGSDVRPDDSTIPYNNDSPNFSTSSEFSLNESGSEDKLRARKEAIVNSQLDCSFDPCVEGIIESNSLPRGKDRKLLRQKLSVEVAESELTSSCLGSDARTSHETSFSNFNEQEKTVSCSRRTSLQQSSVEEIMNGNPQGWATVRKKLPNIAALQKGALTSRRQSKRFVVEQESFLERFSTREYKQDRPAYGQRRASRGNMFLSLSKHHSLSAVDRQDGFSNSHESAISLMPIAEDNSEETQQQNFKFSIPWKRSFFFDFNIMAIIEPHCNYMYYWQYLLLMAINYNAWIVILRISFFNAQSQFSSTWFALDYVGDLIYIFDIFVCMKISFLENGIYVTDIKRVALKYAVSFNFALDALSLLPLDLLYLKFGPNPILRLPRLIKFYKVFQSRKMIESLTSIPNVIRALFLLHLMFLLIHWNGCLYFMISNAEGFGSNSWVYPKLVGRRSKLINQYIHCFYWATLSLTTIGEGRGGPITLAENVYMIVCYITGIFIFATIVGQAGSVIQNMNASRMDFEKQRDNTMQYMKTHNVPKDLQRRVRLWYDYSYSRGRFQGGNDINEMTLLPNKMKTELALHVHLETLRKVSFLQKVQPEFLHDLVLKMKMHIFTPGDYICRKGEIAREMYVISDGILEVVSETGAVLKVLHPGNFFGEIGILSLSGGQNRRTADVRCCGYVELFVLYKDDVLSAIRDYPETQKILSRYGRKRLNRRIGGNGSDGETTESSEQEEKEELDEIIPDPTDKAFEEELKPDGTEEPISQTPEVCSIACPQARRISVDPINPGMRSSYIASPSHSSTPSSPSKSTQVKEQTPSSVTLNIASLDTNINGAVQNNKASLQNAFMSIVSPVLVPASPAIAKGTPPQMRRKKFSESRSISSSSLRKKRLSQPSMTMRRTIDDDITTAMFQSEAKFLSDRQEEKRFFKKSLSEAHFEAMQTLESSFFKKVQKEQLRMKEKIKDLEATIDTKNEDISSLQLRIQHLEGSRKRQKPEEAEIEESGQFLTPVGTLLSGITEQEASC